MGRKPEYFQPLDQMIINPSIDIGKFVIDRALNLNTPLLLTVKTFNNLGLRNSLNSSGDSGKNWGMDRRKDPHEERGGLALYSPDTSSFSIVATDLYGPRGLAITDLGIFVGCTEQIRCYDHQLNLICDITGPYLKWINTIVPIKENGVDLMLAASPKLGTITKFNPVTHEIIGHWFGWQHFPRSIDGTLVTDDRQLADSLRQQDQKSLFFDTQNPDSMLDQLSTPKQASRITGITVVSPDTLAITLFTGELFTLANITGDISQATPTLITDKLLNPHSPFYLSPDINQGLWVVNTFAGEIVRLDQTTGQIDKFELSSIINPDNSKKNWLQSCKFIDSKLVILDSTDNQLIFVDLQKHTRNQVHFTDSTWAVHEMLPYQS